MDLKGWSWMLFPGKKGPLPDAAPGHWGPPSGLQTVFHMMADVERGVTVPAPNTGIRQWKSIFSASYWFVYTFQIHTSLGDRHAPYRERRKRQGFKNKDRHNVFNFLKQLDPMLQEARDLNVGNCSKNNNCVEFNKTAHDRVPTVMLRDAENLEKQAKDAQTGTRKALF